LGKELRLREFGHKGPGLRKKKDKKRLYRRCVERARGVISTYNIRYTMSISYIQQRLREFGHEGSRLIKNNNKRRGCMEGVCVCV